MCITENEREGWWVEKHSDLISGMPRGKLRYIISCSEIIIDLKKRSNTSRNKIRNDYEKLIVIFLKEPV